MSDGTIGVMASAALRCDRCGARALHRATKDGLPDLHFCGHHGQEHAPALREKGFDVVALEPEPASAR